MPRRARVRLGDRQAAKRAGKTKSPPEGRHCGGSDGKQPFEAQKEGGRRKKFFCAPPVYYSDRLPEILHPELYTI